LATPETDSVPTRRSSDLVQGLLMMAFPAAAGAQAAPPPDPLRARNINHVHIAVRDLEESTTFYAKLLGGTVRELSPGLRRVFLRSEEHTSELQSPDHLVC